MEKIKTTKKLPTTLGKHRDRLHAQLGVSSRATGHSEGAQMFGPQFVDEITLDHEFLLCEAAKERMSMKVEKDGSER